MIKVFLHISVHIGTELSELAFPRTERHRGKDSRGLIPQGQEDPGRARHRGRTARQAGERGQGGRSRPVARNLHSRPQGLCPLPHFTDGKISPKRVTGPRAPKQVDGLKQSLL